jgi:cold shock CspA family protein
MATGEIILLSRNRGFGVVQFDRAVEEIVFYRSSVECGAFDQLCEGQYVKFDQEVDPRDPGRNRAVHMRIW